MRLLLFFLLPLTVVFSAQNRSEMGLPLFYWDARVWSDYSPFGDALSERIVERMVGHRIATTFNPHFRKKKLLAIGSIIHHASNADVIWGSGINGKHLDPKDKSVYRFKDLDVRAVRGPFSRKILMEMGIYCPPVFGDPALLMPRLFPELQRKENPRFDYIVMPHCSDEYKFSNMPNIVSSKEYWEIVIDKILDSKFVISTSLHGIVVAEAFGIPARLLISEFEPVFKYQDYYCGTGRPKFGFATTIEEALEMGGEKPPKCDLEKLYQSFPFELFKLPLQD